MKKVKRVEISGRPMNDIRLTPFNYSDECTHYSMPPLPTWAELKVLFIDLDELRIQPGKIVYRVTFKDDSWIEYTFKRGFIWDGASDPVGPNDDPFALLHCRPHDGNFSCHFLRLPTDEHNNEGFRDANKLMYRALRCKSVYINGRRHAGRMPLARAIKYYWGVSTIKGRAVYENEAPRRAPWHGEKVEFKASSPGCWR
jgi:hypothetical protein